MKTIIVLCFLVSVVFSETNTVTTVSDIRRDDNNSWDCGDNFTCTFDNNNW